MEIEDEQQTSCECGVWGNESGERISKTREACFALGDFPSAVRVMLGSRAGELTSRIDDRSTHTSPTILFSASTVVEGDSITLNIHMAFWAVICPNCDQVFNHNGKIQLDGRLCDDTNTRVGVKGVP